MSGIAGIDQLTYKEYEEGIMDRSSLPVFKRLSYLTGLSMDYLLGITDIPDAYKPGDGYMDFDISDRVRGCQTELCHVNQESRYLDQYGRSAIPLPGSQIIQPVIFSHGACKAGKIYETSVDYLARITDDDRPNMKEHCCTKLLTEEQIEKVKERIIKLCPTPVPRTPIEKNTPTG